MTKFEFMRSSSLKIIGSILALIALYLAMASLMSAQEILDARFYYTPTEAANFFAALSPDRSVLYLKHELLDLIFISTYSLLSYLVAEAIFPKPSGLKFWAVVPGLFDLIETVSIIAILSGAPISFFAGWLGFVTCLKWSTGGLLIFVVFARILLLLKKT